MMRPQPVFYRPTSVSAPSLAKGVAVSNCSPSASSGPRASSLEAHFRRDGLHPAAFSNKSMKHPALSQLGKQTRFVACYVRHLGASWDDSQDVAQNTMIRAVENIDDFAGTDEQQLRAWLVTIARNAWFDFCRRAKSQQRRAELSVSSLLSIVNCAGEDACQLQELERGIRAMRPESSETFCLQALGMEYQEIAERTGWAIGTVKSRINRAREALSA